MIEFRNTPSAQLNLEEFHFHDLELEYDPPAFITGVLEDSEEGIELDLKTSSLIQANDLAKDDVFTCVEDEELLDTEEDRFAVLKFDKRQLKVPLPLLKSSTRYLHRPSYSFCLSTILAEQIQRKNLMLKPFTKISRLTLPSHQNGLSARKQKDKRFARESLSYNF